MDVVWQTLLGGAVLAAVIGGAFSFLSLIIAKEQKVSEFRQNWIDELRKDISNVAAAASHMAHRLNDEETFSREEAMRFQVEIRESHETLVRCSASIRLRINPDDSDPALRVTNALLLTQLDELWKAINNRQIDLIFERSSVLSN